MRKPSRLLAALLAVSWAVSSYCFRAHAVEGTFPNPSPANRPAKATPCDIDIPIRIALTPLNEPAAGAAARFAVTFESGIDPDLVKRMWLEYDYPETMRQTRESIERQDIPRLARNERREMSVRVPDRGRYQIRARLMVELVGGRIVSKTASSWINPDNAPPDGMIGRIVNPDGSGTRVYQGSPGK